ncbi:hypothetical protein F4677DRAFT_457119 [Hypoxylon crocopeplum]|nr:hypothetical protein F4677DRAFT_457119 [Hypoxylon crocopeplum]
MVSPGNPVWPPGHVPVELFVMIARHLPSRKDVQNLRLVNREFNEKLMHYFCQQIVVHLGPELTAKLDTGLQSHARAAAIDVTDQLLDSNILRNFGPDIQRFGLALELDESELASPSTGDMEEICVRFWGIYRWPIHPDDYHPNSLLEKVTLSLERVFRLVTSVNNIREFALSCEGGLGYLQGPDINRWQPPGQPAVFGDPNAVRDTPDTSYQVEYDRPYWSEVLGRNLVIAGIDPAHISEKIDEIVREERTTLEKLAHEERSRALLPESRHADETTRPLIVNDKIRLQPDQLTDTQRRFLFQHLSAQQALIHSFITSVLDDGPSFVNLTKINISRLPSFHIHLLCRDDFWSQVPQVEEVALGVVPDWRVLQQRNIYTIEARQVYPTDAIPKVYNLLNNHIGKQPWIKRLHFEWLCGGELAPGCIQRTRHVLPAPFLKEHRKVIDSSTENLLILPFITHLSLKNCWFAPNVFYRIMQTMAETESLESLELETVSLCGPPIFREFMNDVDDQVVEDDSEDSDDSDDSDDSNDSDDSSADSPLQGSHMHTADENAAPEQHTPQQPADEDDEGPPLCRLPLELSWSHIIDMLTPGETIRERVYSEHKPYEPLLIKKDLKLQKLVFKSCGYVEVPDYRFISHRRFRDLRFPSALHSSMVDTAVEYNKKREYVRQFLQVSTDRHLATICPLLDPWEESAMHRVFGFRTGWEELYDQSVIEAAKKDGLVAPGMGRFSGTIEHDQGSESLREHSSEEAVPYVFNTSTFDRDYNDEAGLGTLLAGMEYDLGYRRPQSSWV